jgi:hypothetical protein
MECDDTGEGVSESCHVIKGGEFEYISMSTQRLHTLKNKATTLNTHK